MKNNEEKTLATWEKLRQKNGAGEDIPADPLTRLWTGSANYGQDFQPDVEAGLNRLKGRIQAEEPGAKVVALKSRTFYLRRVAAVAVIALVATLYFSLPEQGPTGGWTTVTTAANETRELILPDGSLVSLNEDTRLSYNTDLNTAAERLIELEGEAFFDVKRRPEQPFSIRTQRAEVKVLGTSFNVRALAGVERTEVEVSTGQVAVRGLGENEETVLLEATDAVVVENDYELYLDNNSPLNSSVWRTGELEFRSSQLIDALEVIERIYQVDLRYDPAAISNCTITGNWSKEDFDAILVILKELTQMEFQPVGEKVYQLSGTCR